MLKVGLTGGIASGKSTVGRMFVERGCRLIDSDLITRELFEPGQPVNNAVAAAFGDVVVGADGRIDRKILAEIVFNDNALRERLNAIVHPAIKRRQQDFLAKVEAEDPHAIGIVEAALIIESGNYANYDRIVLVTCTPEIQRQRLRERSSLTDEQIESRITSQMPLEQKLQHADFVIDNSGNLEHTKEQVSSIHRQLVAVLQERLNML